VSLRLRGTFFLSVRAAKTPGKKSGIRAQRKRLLILEDWRDRTDGSNKRCIEFGLNGHRPRVAIRPGQISSGAAAGRGPSQMGGAGQGCRAGEFSGRTAQALPLCFRVVPIVKQRLGQALRARILPTYRPSQGLAANCFATAVFAGISKRPSITGLLGLGDCQCETWGFCRFLLETTEELVQRAGIENAAQGVRRGCRHPGFRTWVGRRKNFFLVRLVSVAPGCGRYRESTMVSLTMGVAGVLLVWRLSRDSALGACVS